MGPVLTRILGFLRSLSSLAVAFGTKTWNSLRRFAQSSVKSSSLDSPDLIVSAGQIAHLHVARSFCCSP